MTLCWSHISLLGRLIADRIAHYERLRNLRTALEDTWSRSADMKHCRDLEEKAFIRWDKKMVKKERHYMVFILLLFFMFNFVVKISLHLISLSLYFSFIQQLCWILKSDWSEGIAYLKHHKLPGPVTGLKLCSCVTTYSTYPIYFTNVTE